MKRVWDSFLTDQDVAHLAALPRAERFGFGRVPVVLSVDNYRGVIGDEPEPLLDAINTWPESMFDMDQKYADVLSLDEVVT